MAYNENIISNGSKARLAHVRARRIPICFLSPSGITLGSSLKAFWRTWGQLGHHGGCPKNGLHGPILGVLLNGVSRPHPITQGYHIPFGSCSPLTPITRSRSPSLSPARTPYRVPCFAKITISSNPALHQRGATLDERAAKDLEVPSSQTRKNQDVEVAYR